MSDKKNIYVVSKIFVKREDLIMLILKKIKEKFSSLYDIPISFFAYEGVIEIKEMKLKNPTKFLCKQKCNNLVSIYEFEMPELYNGNVFFQRYFARSDYAKELELLAFIKPESNHKTIEELTEKDLIYPIEFLTKAKVKIDKSFSKDNNYIAQQLFTYLYEEIEKELKANKKIKSIIEALYS